MINTRVSNEYFGHLRMPVLRLAHDSALRVLDIGCGAGESLVYFKNKGANFVAGVELVPEMAEIGRSRPEIDRIYVGDIEKMDLDIEEASLDLIIASHVLEHLADPWSVLRKLRTLLKSGGQLIGALPNVRHVSVLLPLIVNGRWEYQKDGIMDWTHLRFFSRKTVAQLLQDTGFQVEKIVPETDGKSRILDSASCGLFRNVLAYANNFSATNSRT